VAAIPRNVRTRRHSAAAAPPGKVLASVGERRLESSRKFPSTLFQKRSSSHLFLPFNKYFLACEFGNKNVWPFSLPENGEFERFFLPFLLIYFTRKKFLVYSLGVNMFLFL
jgi:hypothetical protein